jgi:hypothetical protein
LIEGRSDNNSDPDELEPSYAESVRRFNARQQNEDLWDRLRYHEAMMEAHTCTFRQILDKHQAGRERCKAMLGLTSPGEGKS